MANVEVYDEEMEKLLWNIAEYMGTDDSGFFEYLSPEHRKKVESFHNNVRVAMEDLKIEIEHIPDEEIRQKTCVLINDCVNNMRKEALLEGFLLGIKLHKEIEAL